MKFNAIDLVKFAKYKLGCGYVYGTYGDICNPTLRQRKAIQYPTQAYNILQVAKKWDGLQVFDCAGLIKGYIFTKLGTRYARQYDKGATGMYRDWCKRGGKWQTMPDEPGTLVFKGKPGKFPHVGIYIGGGKVIESKSSRDGVVETAFKGGGWNYWGQPSIFEYGITETVSDSDADRPTVRVLIRRGDKGVSVRDAQNMLIQAGYGLARFGADADFGEETELAVKMFQADAKLKQDGIIGQMTWNALYESVKPSVGRRELMYIPSKMMRGEDVKLLQERLAMLGLFKEEPHGAFNAHTDTAVRRYQKIAGLQPTGAVDDELWQIMNQK